MPKRYCLLDCEDAEKWKGHEKYYKQLFEPDAQWDVFQCFNGALPPLDALPHYTAIFISGSHYSAYERRTWIKQLKAYLRTAVLGRKVPMKLVGLCFGCQLLAEALGGRVGPNTDGAFVLKVENIQLLTGALKQCGLPTSLPSPTSSSSSRASPSPSPPPTTPLGPCLRLLESHGDQVLDLPAGAVLLGSSPTAQHEAWWLDGRVLALQGHPELDTGSALDKILPAVVNNGLLTEQQAQECKASLSATIPHQHAAVHLIQAFINTPYTTPTHSTTQTHTRPVSTTNTDTTARNSADDVAGDTNTATTKTTSSSSSSTNVPPPPPAGVPSPSSSSSIWQRMRSLTTMTGSMSASMSASMHSNTINTPADAGDDDHTGGHTTASVGGDHHQHDTTSSVPCPPASTAQPTTTTDTSTPHSTSTSTIPPSTSTSTLGLPSFWQQLRLTEATAAAAATLRTSLGGGGRAGRGGGGGTSGGGGSVQVGEEEGGEQREVMLAALQQQVASTLYHTNHALSCETRIATNQLDTLCKCNHAIARRIRNMEAYATGMAAFVGALEEQTRPLEDVGKMVGKVEEGLRVLEARVGALDVMSVQLCAQLGIPHSTS